MRTKEEIFARYQSDETEDMFGAQKTALLCMLPYEMAKPHLDPIYVEKHEKDELPEDERWKEDWDIKDQIIDFLPEIYRDLKKNDTYNVAIGFCYLRSWLWVDNPSFFDIIEPMFKEGGPADAKPIVDSIARFYGYEEPITEVPFEEIADNDTESDTMS